MGREGVCTGVGSVLAQREGGFAQGGTCTSGSKRGLVGRTGSVLEVCIGGVICTNVEGRVALLEGLPVLVVRKGGLH